MSLRNFSIDFQLFSWKPFPPIVGKQASHLQNSTKTNVDVWNRTLGMCFQVQHSSHSAIPIQTSQNYNQCPTVCLKSHPAFGPTSPVRPHGFPRKDSYSSRGPGIAPKPTSWNH